LCVRNLREKSPESYLIFQVTQIAHATDSCGGLMPDGSPHFAADSLLKQLKRWLRASGNEGFC
jgi:hypothetical protein